jgi:phosphohistidine phosphatase SixA
VSASTPVFLIRHAKAGSRRDWDGPDEERPLSKAGRRQADGIAGLLGDQGVVRILSSPFVRCRQTVEPLGDRLHMVVEPSDALAEGAPLSDALRLVEKFADEVVALCTHGDVVEELLGHLRRAGVVNGDARLEKGSTWVLHLEHGDVTGAEYVAPPV